MPKVMSLLQYSTHNKDLSMSMKIFKYIENNHKVESIAQYRKQDNVSSFGINGIISSSVLLFFFLKQ